MQGASSVLANLTVRSYHPGMTTNPIDPRRIEELHLLFTAPREQVVYDGWLVRRAPNDVKRARSVNAFYASTKPVQEKIDHCERLYAEAGLPSLFRLTPFSRPESLDAALAERGYERIETDFEQVAHLNRPLPAPPEGVTFHPMLLEDWLELAAPIRGQSEAMREAEFRRLHHGEVPGYCLLARVGDEAVACGLVMQEQEFATLMDINVAPPWRRQGLGTAISAQLLTTARRNGAEIAWLSVLADNIPAIRTYAKLGFETLYEYWYRVKEAPLL